MSNFMINEAQNYIEKIRHEYIQKHSFEQERDELIAENNIEKRDVKGYHGREILELLQNADDAYQKSIDVGSKPECELIVTIKYLDNILTVTNTGTSFDKDGIKAIVQGNNSPKSGKYIGNKGTGFRSILNWARAVRIFSGEFNIEFSEDIAKKEFEKLRNLPQIQKQLNKKSNLYFPMLAIPKWIDNDKYNNATTIEVDIDPQKLNDNYSVEKQIDNIDLRILLFLPNISQIEIITHKGKIIYKREVFQGDIPTVLLQKIVDGDIEIQEKFYLFNKKIENMIKEDGVLKDIILSIAVPHDFESFKRGYLYSFFPLLDTESPFNCVMHASYALGDHRNTITSNDTNKVIIQSQIEFLFEIVNFFCEKKQYDIAYELLIPINFQTRNWRFLAPFSKFELEDFYLNTLLKQKIFVSVNDDNLSIKDGIKIISGDYPEFFIGKAFASLLKPLNNEKMIQLIEFVAEKEDIEVYFFEDELLKIINSVSGVWSVSQRVNTFVWWNSSFDFDSSLPRLLKKQNGKWLNCKEECFLLIGNFENSNLPTWVKIPALDKEYQDELLKITELKQEFVKIKESGEEKRTERIICQNNLYPSASFKYRDMNNIITAVNSSVNTYKKAVDFIKWLWKNYGKKEGWNPPGQSENGGIRYNFPSTIEKNVVESGKIYFGSDYGNKLAEKLFDETYGVFPSMSSFDIDIEEKGAFIEFISKFGVKKYPIIELLEIKTPINSYCKELKKEIAKNGDMGSSSIITTCTYKLPFIKNLQDILENLSTLDIIEWIHRDNLLYSNLCNPYASEADIRYQGNLQQYPRRYYGKVKNYILETFNETKWVTINGSRYSPRQILQNFKARNNQRFSSLVPVLNIEDLEEISRNLNVVFEVVFEIFAMFNFADKVTELGSNDFYGLLLNLSSLDIEESCEMFKQIYRIVEQKAFSKDYEDSDNKKRFFSEGKILVRYKGQLKYWIAKEAFLPSTKIINKKNYPIVEKGLRTNNENFIRIFGCKEYSNEYKIVFDSIIVSSANEKFQEYYRCFQKYARAYDESNENIEKYGNEIKVTLVDKIQILENNNIEEIEDEYTLIRDSMTNWYVTVRENEFDINAISEIIEIIYSNIANTPGFDSNKIGELFRTPTKENREFLIMKEFGTLNVIDDSYYKNAIKNNFIKTINKIAPDFDVNELNIDFEKFSNLSNIPNLISVLKKLNVDVDVFKQEGFIYSLELIPYYQKEVEDFVFKEKERFKNVLFSRAQKDITLQDSFLETVDKFENFNIFVKYRNSVHFDMVEEFVDNFGEWQSEDGVSAEKVYSENYKKMNPDRRFEDELANDKNVKKMIYFGQVDKFNAWLIQKEIQEQNSHNPSTDFDPYYKLRGMIPILGNLSYNNKVAKKDSDKHGSSHSVYIESQAQKQRRKQKLLGNKGELLVYNFLCNKFGKENVFQKSEAFVEMGLLTAGQASSGDYDIAYIDEEKNTHFVEVKTGSKQSFIISQKELEFAMKHSDRYELFLVYNVDSETPEFIKLPERFWENEKFRRNDIIERIEFDF